jgi:hypothetical protein
MRMRAIVRAWRCFIYKDIDHRLKCEHECTPLRLPRTMASMILCPYFNIQNRSFTNCSCLKVVEDFDAATDELWSVASLSKNKQERYYKDWINGHEMTKL